MALTLVAHLFPKKTRVDHARWMRTMIFHMVRISAPRIRWVRIVVCKTAPNRGAVRRRRMDIDKVGLRIACARMPVLVSVDLVGTRESDLREKGPSGLFVLHAINTLIIHLGVQVGGTKGIGFREKCLRSLLAFCAISMVIIYLVWLTVLAKHRLVVTFVVRLGVEALRERGLNASLKRCLRMQPNVVKLYRRQLGMDELCEAVFLHAT